MADVLVVDDDPAHRTPLVDALIAAGHSVRVAAGGRSAMVAVADRRPEVVVAELVMPDLAGDRFARWLTSVGVPVLLLGAAREWVAPADLPFLVKPVDLDRVKELVAGLAARGLIDRASGMVAATDRRRRWRLEEDALVMATPVRATSVLAARLGRTVAAVQQRRSRLRAAFGTRGS